METLITARDIGVRFRVSRLSRDGVGRRLGRTSDHAWGIRGVSLTLNRGEVLGLIGHNGAGKTTLLRALAGIYPLSEGTIVRKGSIGSLLSPSAGLAGELSGWENIRILSVILGTARKDVPAIAREIADFCGLEKWLDAPVRTYSSGMGARLGFSIALHARPDILLLDEVMAVGDENFRKRSSEALQDHLQNGGGVVLSSHNVKDLADSCHAMIRLRSGSISDEGDPERVVRSYIAEHGDTPRSLGRNLAAITPRTERAPHD